ncbi:MAG TPA: hypothetical protein EYQ09_04325 [Flavobacteriales bacterium]|nr:hypothetical protein [Flavobacteriales bacterium]
MNKILPAILIAFFSLLTFNSMGSNPTEWEIYFENDTLKIEYTYQNCDFSSTAKQEIIVFKFTNLISQNILLSYKTDIWHNDVCTNCEQESEESRYTIQIPSNETITTNCSDEWRGYAIFSAFITNDEKEQRYASLTKFELKEITISHE